MAAFLLKIPNQLTRLRMVRSYYDRNGQKILDDAIGRVAERITLLERTQHRSPRQPTRGLPVFLPGAPTEFTPGMLRGEHSRIRVD